MEMRPTEMMTLVVIHPNRDPIERADPRHTQAGYCRARRSIRELPEIRLPPRTHGRDSSMTRSQAPLHSGQQ
jgi:hypothetical protein